MRVGPGVTNGQPWHHKWPPPPPLLAQCLHSNVAKPTRCRQPLNSVRLMVCGIVRCLHIDCFTPTLYKGSVLRLVSLHRWTPILATQHSSNTAAVATGRTPCDGNKQNFGRTLIDQKSRWTLPGQSTDVSPVWYTTYLVLVQCITGNRLFLYEPVWAGKSDGKNY